MGRGTKKVETNWVRKILHNVKKDDCKHSNHTQKRSDCVISCHSIGLSLVWCRVLLRIFWSDTQQLPNIVKAVGTNLLHLIVRNLDLTSLDYHNRRFVDGAVLL